MHDSVDLGLKFMIQVENDGIKDCSKEEWIKIDEDMRKLWDTILASIRKHFREILGVVPTSSHDE